MTIFTLSAQVTVSAWTKVEAASLDEAIKIAADRPAVIGGWGSGEDENESWIIEEADGSAENIRSGD